MGRSIAVMAALLVGVGLAVQGPINSELSRHLGQMRAVLISALVTTSTLLLIVLAHAPTGSFAALADTPRWTLAGGLLGVVTLLGTVVAVPRIGVAATTATTVATQLVISAVIDRFGLLGVAVRPISPPRLGGLVLLVLAVLLVMRG